MTKGHANRGKRWEAQLDTWHRAYMALGRAYVVRTPPPVRVLGAVVGGRFPACFEGEGPPDYLAVVEGRALVFDAKRTAGRRLPFASIKDHQAAHFDRATAAGAVAWLAVSCEIGEFVVLWTAIRDEWWRWRREGGRPASLDLGEPREGVVRMAATGWVSLGLWRAA